MTVQSLLQKLKGKSRKDKGLQITLLTVMEAVGGFSELKRLSIPEYIGVISAISERDKIQKKEMNKNMPTGKGRGK